MVDRIVVGSMMVWLGTFCFGMVLGWVAAFVFHRNRAILRELKSLLSILFGAALQTLFAGTLGIIVYGVGVGMGAALYGVTILVRSLRRAHEFRM